MTTPRRSVNIHDYPEHLNPFFEDDNHTKLRFWTNTKRKTRSNSFNFSTIKDFKQSLFSRPTLRKRSGTSSSSLSQLSCYRTHEINDETPQNVEFSRSDEKRKSFIYPTLRKLGRSFSIRSKSKKARDESVERPTPQTPENEAAYYSYSRSTVSNRQTLPAETTYREPVTPLPRSRFHERLRSTEVEKSHESNDGTNPFKDEDDDVKVQVQVPVQVTPSTSKPTTPPRKKKRAPPPPPMRQSSLTRKSLSAEFSLCGREHEDNTTTNETNHKDIERTDDQKVENEKSAVELEIPKIVVSTESVESEINDVESPTTSENIEENPQEPFELNYNSELNISSSQLSVNSETKLEEKHQKNAVEDSSDLLELVQKLQLEVEKLTDDTNNNVIASTFDSSKKANLYGYDCGYDNTMNTSSVTTEINMGVQDGHAQDIQDTQDTQDDDNDVVIGAPLSPRFVRLRKDNEWIKH